MVTWSVGFICIMGIDSIEHGIGTTYIDKYLKSHDEERCSIMIYKIRVAIIYSI
jgi:hypothetical protein